MLENLVDETFTSIYHVTIRFHFFANHDAQFPKYIALVDLILPISKSSPDNVGHWFWLQNTSNIQSQKLLVPSNSYRDFVEIYVLAHVNDEFWYSNPSDAYIEANNLTTPCGNGAFREVVSFIDGVVVGAM